MRKDHAERERSRYHAIKIWIKCIGPIPEDELGRKYHIHHKDRNWRNNSLDNLECLAPAEHYKAHRMEFAQRAKNHLGKFLKGNQFGKKNSGKIRSPESRMKVAAARRGVPMSEETKRRIALSSIGKNKGRKKSQDEIVRREATKAAKRLADPAYDRRK